MLWLHNITKRTFGVWLAQSNIFEETTTDGGTVRTNPASIFVPHMTNSDLECNYWTISILHQLSNAAPKKKISPIQFKTKNTKKDSFNFMLTGDWGWNSYNQTLTAYQMGVYSWLISAEFVIALGDNFYNDGVTNTTDPLWYRAFHNVYTSKYLQIPWFPVLGNHDYHGNVSAQVERTALDNGVWTMPDKYYYYNYEIPGGGILCIVYIDTCLIDPSAHDTEAIYSNPNWEQLRQDHLDWIEDVLAEQNKTATWLLVAGHYPVYSVGDSGDNQNMIDNLLPIMKNSGVHAYICGHDHNHQHIYKDNFHFFVDGAGGGRGPLGPNGLRHLGISAATNNMKNYFVNCGFSFVEVTSDALKVNFVDNIGRIQYVGVLDNPLQNGDIYSKAYSGISVFYSTNPVLSMFLLVVVGAIPVAIVGVYSYSKLREKFPLHAVQRDTAIDVSERSTTAFFESEHGKSTLK
eukprot:gene3151-6201_t